MVKFHQVNDWMKLLGNLGVFAGLMLVALQMQQANQIAQGEHAAERSKAYQDLEIGIMGEEAASVWVKSIFNPASMTREDIRIMDAMLVTEVGVIKRIGIQERAGLLPPGSFKNEIATGVAYWFGNEFAQTWWKYEQEHQGDAEFVGYMNERMESLEDNHTARWVMLIERDIRDLPPVTEANLEKN